MVAAAWSALATVGLKACVLAVLAEADEAGIGQLGGRVGPGGLVAAADVGLDLGQADAAEARRRAGEGGSTSSWTRPIVSKIWAPR